MRWLVVFFISFQGILSAVEGKKVLLLIVASDNYPVYGELQKCWRSYMHSDPDHVEAYFIKANPRLSSDVQIDGDIIWSKSPTDTSGIIHKTVNSMEFFLPRIKNEFNYVIRANLSSFYSFSRLLKFLETLPKTGCYCGDNTGGDSIIGSGAGVIFSPDIIELLVLNKSKLCSPRHSMSPDDCIIGFFLKDNGIHLQRHTKINVGSLSEWNQIKGEFPENIFQVRIKTNTGNEYLRLPDDFTVYSELLDMFYGLHIP